MLTNFQSELLTKIQREGDTLSQVLCRQDWLVLEAYAVKKSLVHCGEKQAKNF